MTRQAIEDYTEAIKKSENSHQWASNTHNEEISETINKSDIKHLN